MAAPRGRAGDVRAAWVCALVLLVGCGRLGYDASGSGEGDRDGGGSSADATAPDEADAGESTMLECKDAVCDLVPQCGCEVGDGCSVSQTGDRICRPAGDVLHSGACTGFGSGECIAGAECLSMGDWPPETSACFQFCNSTADCELLGLGSLCAVAANSGGSLLFNACTLPCDLFEQTGCPSGTQCSLYNFGTTAGTNCTGPGTAAAGQSCGVHFDCGPAMMCLGGACRELCVVGEANQCQGGTSCADTGLVMSGLRVSIELGGCI